MRTLSLALSALCTVAFAACSVSNDALQSQITDPEIIGPAIPSDSGIATGVIGLHQLRLDAQLLSATLLPVRTAMTQGDLYELSVRPFFGPQHVRVRRVERGAAPGSLLVDIDFRHPFAAPEDLNPPASASKRIDLHIFDVTALLIIEGSDSFFNNAIQTNARVLSNADGYRDPGQTFDRAALGIAQADIFPYRLVAQDLDTGAPQGNYDPFGHGWTDLSLLVPRGYDIFPQGGEATVQFAFDLSTTPTLDLHLVLLAKYMDPRATPDAFTKRLPLPGDPTSLRYFLPEAAGDIQRIAATVTGTLNGNSSSESATVDLTILDWDHGAIVADPFPNNANLNEIRHNSDVGTIDISLPQLRAAQPFAVPPVSGAAPLLTASTTVSNIDLFDPTSPTLIRGLVRVTDAQDAGSFPAVALNESLAPVAPLSSTRYQVIGVTVNPGVVTGPVTVTLLPPPAVGVNNDMGTDAISYAFLSDYVTKGLISEGNGDMYTFFLRDEAPVAWVLYRSTNGGATWGNRNEFAAFGVPTQLTTVRNGLGLGILANGLPAMAVIDVGYDLGYIAAQSESGNIVTLLPLTSGVEIDGEGSWKDPVVLPHPTNANRVYVVSENYFISGTPAGPNHGRISVYLSTNAASQTPTFSLLAGTADSLDSGLERDEALRGVFDAANRFHLVWANKRNPEADSLMYRRFDDDGSPTGGVWAAPELEIASGTALSDPSILVNLANEPIVAFKDTEPDATHTNDNRVLLTKFSAGGGWSTPVRVNDPPSVSAEPNIILFPDMALDSAGRIHFVWRDSRQGPGTIYELWGTVLSGDGQTKLSPGDFEIIPGVDTSYEFITAIPSIEWDPVSQRMTVTGKISGTNGTGQLRYQQYTVAP